MKKKAHDIIAKFADRGLRSLAVAKQVTFYTTFSLTLFELSSNREKIELIMEETFCFCSL